MNPETDRRGTAPPEKAPKKEGGFARFKPYLAPLLITCILAIGNIQYRILEGHAGLSADATLLNGTVLAILTSILAELVLSRTVTGRWPHLASCYITGISVGILVRSTYVWPYVVCSLLSITSKYALRVKGRHLWNPSNLGVSVLLFLAADAVAPLSQQWGNDIWVPLIILTLGSLILYSLGRLHITATYVAAFVVLSYVRSQIAQTPFEYEVGLLTAPAYLLFMFFMITDPKTTTHTRRRQCAVAVLVAVVETILRLAREIHAPYYALFIVAPVTNLLEIWYPARKARETSPAAAALPVAPPAKDGAATAAQETPTVAGPSVR
jgi:Na+-transporting NADH:ubiquinone oxidoreductase subunit NqrB